MKRVFAVKRVFFGIFKIYDICDKFLGVDSGSLDRIEARWRPKGGTRFGSTDARWVDEPEGTVYADGIVRPELAPKPTVAETPVGPPPPPVQPSPKPLKLARYVKDHGEIETHARAAVAEHPAEADRYRKGKTALVNFFVAKVMERTDGGADPQTTRDVLSRVLSE